MAYLKHVGFAAALGLLFSAAAAGADDGVHDRIDAYVKSYADAGLYSGVVLVADGERILFEDTYGAADPRSGAPLRLDTIFPIASLSKSVTAAAVVNLEREKRLSFDDPLARTYPEFPNAANITLDQLLRHTSGVGLIEDPDFS